MESALKVGQSFKKNDVIAHHDRFFTENDQIGTRFNIGSLQKVAIYSTGETFEDSTFITNKMAEDLSSDVVMKKSVALGPNTNVQKMVKVGDMVEVGDELLIYESSYQQDYLNDLLANVGEELGEEIKSYGKKPIKSKYSGEVVNIQVYYTVDLDQLTPSLKKIVDDYSKRVNSKKKLLDKYKNEDDGNIFKCGTLVTETTEKTITKDGKIKGEYVGEGVLIEISIKYHDKAKVGDKIVNFCALKSIVGNVIPEGQEPFSEYRPEEEISTFIPPAAVIARMTPSVNITIGANKVVVELTRALEEIYNS